MPSGAVNNDVYLDGEAHWVYTYPGGSTIEGYVDIPVSRAARRFRPASSSNRKRPDHTRAPGSWTHFGSRSSQVVGDLYLPTGPSDGYTISGDLLQYNWYDVPNVGMVDDLLNQARLQALGQVTNRTQQLNEALRQAADTGKMFGDFAKRAASGLDTLTSKGGIKKSISSLIDRKTGLWKTIPEEYLQYCYGLAPLGDDIANAVKVLADQKAQGYKFSLTLKATKKDFAEHPGPWHAGVFSLYHGRCIYRDELAARVSYVIELPDWWQEQLPLVAPFSSEWAAQPFSFVLDWAYPIGNWLLAVEAAQLAPFFKEGSETQWVRRTTLTSEFVGGDGKQLSGPPFTCNGWHMRRVALGDLPSALTTPPSLRNPLSIRTVSQGMALLTQAFKRWLS